MKTIAIESLQNVPEYTGLSNHETITIREGQEWDGHTYGFCVGMIKEDGTVKSCFKEDRRNGNTQLFDRLKAEMDLYEKHCHLRKRDSLDIILHSIQTGKSLFVKTNRRGFLCRRLYECTIQPGI